MLKLNILLFFYLFITRYFLPPLRGHHAPCNKISYSKRETKLKTEESFPLYALYFVGYATDGTSNQGLYIAVADHNCGISSGQGFIPRATPHAFLLTNPRHSQLSCTILLDCLTSKPLKQSFIVSIHLFRGFPTERLPEHYYT